MYQTTRFETLLTREAGLLSLQKQDCDLFLIAQTNTITYAQLCATGIHGHTGTGGRLSLKKLETEGYLASKSIPALNGLKYYILTAKGKKRLERVFSTEFLIKQGIDLERRPPTSQLQLPHRINTADLYYSFISCPTLKSLPRWTLEYGYAPPTNPYTEKEHPPRCDAKLITAQRTYYLEQDNGTQGDAALENKIRQYLDSNLFLGKALQSNILVFTSMAELKEKAAGKPPYTIYRLLLKTTRIWHTIEETTSTTYDFTGIFKQISENAHPAHALLSSSERRVLQNLSLQHPVASLSDVLALKKQYLYDTTLTDSQKKEQDMIFKKRLELRFYHLSEDNKQATLLYRLRQGMHLYVLPNHRIKDWLSYLFTEDYNFSEKLLQFLYGAGLYNIESWDYHPLYQLRDSKNTTFCFSHVLTAGKQNCIIFEDICHDLGGRARVRYFLTNYRSTVPVILFLFVTNKQEAIQFFRDEKHIWQYAENKAMHLCFLDKTGNFYANPENSSPYCIHMQNETVSYATIYLDYDSYSEQIHLVERQAEQL